MADRGPEPNDPLSPYYPSRVPSIPGNVRTWVALLMVGILLLGMGYWIVPYIVSFL